MMNPIAVLLAYIDPGSGSFLLQMLLAGLVGVTAFFRRYIFGWFRRSKKADGAPEMVDSVPPAPDTKQK